MYLIIALILALVAVVLADVVSRRREAAKWDAVRARLAVVKAELLAVREQQQLLATLELESVTLRVIALRNRADVAVWVHHNINTRARVDAWVRPRVAKQSAAIRAAVAGRSVAAVRAVIEERQALTRIAARNTGSGLRVHIRINRRAESRAWRAAKAAEHAARMAAMDAQLAADEAMWDERLAAMAAKVAAHEAQYEQLDEEQEAADLGYASVEEMLVARRTPNLAYDSVDEYSLLDEDQEVEQRALCELKAIWNQ